MILVCMIYVWNLHRLNIQSVHGKNGFAEVSKSLAGYKSKNNFIKLSKWLRRKLKLLECQNF